MNLYVYRPLGERRAQSVEVTLRDAEGRIVGKITHEVADWLVSNGMAMDLTGQQ